MSLLVLMDVLFLLASYEESLEKVKHMGLTFQQPLQHCIEHRYIDNWVLKDKYLIVCLAQSHLGIIIVSHKPHGACGRGGSAVR